MCVCVNRMPLLGGGANWSTNARVLLNVTFQEPGPSETQPAAAASDEAKKMTHRAAVPTGARLCEGGWEDEVEGGWKGRARRKRNNTGDVEGGDGVDDALEGEVRRIHGFTYHCHDSVTGRYAVSDFL